MIDNFDKFIREFKKWEFYFIQIIKRAKDNPWVRWINWNNHERCIKEYSIYTNEDLEKRKEEMITIANATNSRIYIHPARRSVEDIKKLMSLLIWEHIALGRHWLSWLYRHACWFSKWTERLRIVDIDDIKGLHEKQVAAWEIVLFINSLRPEWNKILLQLPTKNWWHLITKPFDLSEFKKEYPNIDVHKNNPTLLYIN